MISSTAFSYLVAILLGGPGLSLGHHAGSWPVFRNPSSPTVAALAALKNPSILNMEAPKNPSSLTMATLKGSPFSTNPSYSSPSCRNYANTKQGVTEARHQGLESAGAREVNKSEFLVHLLRRKKRNNSMEDTGYSMGYGMAMVEDLLGHRNDINRNADAIEEHRNQKTNLNIPEQAIIRSL